jgi:hypothetical protein
LTAASLDEILIAIDDDYFDELVQGVREIMESRPGPPVRFVRASELGDPNTEAVLWFGCYVPTAPGRHKIFTTEALELYEQDTDGLVYKDGEMAWPTPPVAFGNPRTRVEGQLRHLHEAALLFSGPSERPGSHAVRIRMTGRLLDLGGEPPRTAPGFIQPGWLEQAHQAMLPFGPDIAPPE